MSLTNNIPSSSLATKLNTIIISILVLILISSINPTTSQTCKSTCGPLPVKYPFGTGSGCGDPRFQTHVTCNINQQHLTFITHTGCYPITEIDYSNQIIYVTDPSMSTCDCTQPSKGFSLDWDAPFSFHDDTVFALLNCDVSSSPIFIKSDDINRNNNNSSSLSILSPVCDTGSGSRVCERLNSCEAVSRLGVMVSTSCCVYTPVDLGPSFEMDLQKLNCGSYSSLYGFNEHPDNPDMWKYGVAIKYKFNFNNEYPPMCADCEKSNGICGYEGPPYNSFVCNCRSGVNTTTDCSFESTSWNGSSRFHHDSNEGLWMYALASLATSIVFFKF